MPLETLENGKSFLEQRTKINAAVDEINSITDGTISGDIPVTATGTTTPRTLGDRFADVINVKDFGAIGDGVTDDTAAIQASLNYAQNLGGNCTVDLNRGAYLKSDLSATLSLYGVDNVTITNGTILHDDKDTNPRRDLIAFNNCKNLVLSDLIIEGTLQEYQNETNQSQCLTGENLSNFRMEGVTIRNNRFMATAFNRVSGAIITGCTIENSLRDGFRFTRSTGIVVDGNYLKNVSDDCIALHSEDGEVELSSNHVVTNNTIIGCQGIKILGGKNVVVSSNNLTLCIRNPIQIKMATTFLAEGSTQVYSVNVTNNVITDSFGVYGSNYTILIGSDATRNVVVGSTPNITVAPYNTNYNNNVLITDLNGGTAGINVHGNMIRRTRPTGVAYSTFGFGQKLDRTASPIFTDPILTSDSFYTHGLQIEGPTRDFTISANHFSGMGSGRSCILGAGADISNSIQHINMVIRSNTFSDTQGAAISFAGNTGAGSNQMRICDNIFDLDPFFSDASHNADNTWSSAGFVLGVNITNSEDVEIRGCTFKNMGRAWNSGFSGILHDNTLYADFVAVDDAANKGIRILTSSLRSNRVIPINGDPTSATYGKVLNPVPKESSGIPTGKFLIGTFVNKTSQNINAAYSVIGWWRLTTGTGDVIGTDWLQLKAYKD